MYSLSGAMNEYVCASISMSMSMNLVKWCTCNVVIYFTSISIRCYKLYGSFWGCRLGNCVTRQECFFCFEISSKRILLYIILPRPLVEY